MRIIITNQGNIEFSSIKKEEEKKNNQILPMLNKQKPNKNENKPIEPIKPIKTSKSNESNKNEKIEKEIKQRLIQLNCNDLSTYLLNKNENLKVDDKNRLVLINNKRLLNWNRLCMKENLFYSKDSLQKAVHNKKLIEEKGIEFDIKESLLIMKSSLVKAKDCLKFGNVKVFKRNDGKLNENHDKYKRYWVKHRLVHLE